MHASAGGVTSLRTVFARAGCAFVAVASIALSLPEGAAGQQGCWACRRWRDEIAIGAGSLAIALGTTVAVARINGGFGSQREAMSVFISSLAASAIAGSRAHADRDRFEDVLVWSGAGAAVGYVAGLVFWDGANETAAKVAGFGLGLLAGAIVGSIVHEDDPAQPGAPTLLTVPVVTLRW